MLRLGASLPFRLMRDANSKQLTPLPTIASSTVWQRHFSTTEPREIKRRGALIHVTPRLRKKKKYTDPQQKRVSEARQRKNLARQAVLREERAITLGDPIRGKSEPTSFVKSLDEAIDPEDAAAINPSGTGEHREVNADPQSVAAEMTDLPPSTMTEKDAPKPRFLNAFITPSKMEEALERSRLLVKHPEESRTAAVDRVQERQIASIQSQEHETATEAITRILAVQGANAKGRKHINIQRCIEEFGRHNTNAMLAPTKPGATIAEATAEDASVVGDSLTNAKTSLTARERIGPDTGSSEVQIAILTAKIRRLADEQEGNGRQDKVNKRNLRLLVHRRQKLLRYFMKKSRGGPTWQHLIETLGLTPATWKGEISL